jgi:hypothetical protein
MKKIVFFKKSSLFGGRFFSPMHLPLAVSYPLERPVLFVRSTMSIPVQRGRIGGARPVILGVLFKGFQRPTFAAPSIRGMEEQMICHFTGSNRKATGKGFIIIFFKNL